MVSAKSPHDLARWLLDAQAGPAALRDRLDAYVAAGEMTACDTEAAARMLHSSLQLLLREAPGAAGASAADRAAEIERVCAAFLQAHRPTPEPDAD